MDSVEDILRGVFDNGLRSPYTHPDTVALATFRDEVEEMIAERADMVRRAVLLEKINGMELVWEQRSIFGRGNVDAARTSMGTYVILDGEFWTMMGGMPKEGGKAGALADYKARIAAELGVDWP
jgi:hypothetical protein